MVRPRLHGNLQTHSSDHLKLLPAHLYEHISRQLIPFATFRLLGKHGSCTQKCIKNICPKGSATQFVSSICVLSISTLWGIGDIGKDASVNLPVIYVLLSVYLSRSQSIRLPVCMNICLFQKIFKCFKITKTETAIDSFQPT